MGCKDCGKVTSEPNSVSFDEFLSFFENPRGVSVQGIRNVFYDGRFHVFVDFTAEDEEGNIENHSVQLGIIA